MKRYGQWGGNPKGVKEDPKRCIVSVTKKNFYIDHQCDRPRGHGKDGAYCKQHSKIYQHRDGNL
jgi:hypothetical protein